MGILKGKDLLVSVGTTVCGYATNCELSIDVDTQETASTSWKQMNNEGSGSWKSFDINKKTWTVSTDSLSAEDLLDFKSMFTSLTSGAEVDIKFGVVTYTAATGDNMTAAFKANAYYQGKGLVTSLKMSGGTDGEATYSVSIQGTGELALKTA